MLVLLVLGTLHKYAPGHGTKIKSHKVTGPPQSDRKNGLPKMITKGDLPEQALCYIEID